MKKTFVALLLSAFVLQAYAENVRHWERSDNQVKIYLDEGTLLVTPQNENAIRIQYMYGRNAAPLPEIIFIPPADRTDYAFRENGNELEISVPRLKVSVMKQGGNLTFRNERDEVLLAEKPDGRTLHATDLGEEKTYSVEQRFKSPTDEYLFGTGQFQDGYLNIRGLSRRLVQQNTQISIPFVLSSKGYGLLWHNYGLTYFNPLDHRIALTRENRDGQTQVVDATSTEGTKKEVRKLNLFSGDFRVSEAGKYALLLDVGSKMGKKHRIKVDGKQVSDVNNIWLPSTTSLLMDLEAGRHTVEVEAASNDKPVFFFGKVTNETVFRSPVADCIDYTVFGGYGDEVIGSYRSLTGHAPLMPKWALGYIHCRERFKSQDELLQTAREFRNRRLPVDLMVQDWLYWGKYGWNAMQFDETTYPDPAGMVSALHGLNMRLMLSVWSKIDQNSAVGKEFEKHKYYIDNTTWVDFFNPEAAAFYWSHFSRNLLSKDIDAWWQDATEPENDDLHGRMVARNTLQGDRVRNIYPIMVCKTVYEGSRKDKPGKRTMILTRSGFSGLQRYAAATWSGDVGNDWETLRRQIAGGLNYMASGLPWWTYDAGGFFRPGNQYKSKDYHECFLRWFQTSTFLPLQRVHGYQTDTEFWNFGTEVMNISKKYLDFRYRMLPYIYSEAAAVTFKGSTLMRPFVMDFARDRKALECRYAYMFGPSLLVAPVVYPGQTVYPVYLPDAGNSAWYDFWTGQVHQGGSTVDVPVSLDKIPLFVRAGSILPLGEAKQHTEDKPGDAWEIRIYPGKDARYTLYEDEGTNYDYEQGAYSTFDLIWDDKKQVLTLSDRKGSFRNMVTKRYLKIVKVSPRQGIGMEESGRINKKVLYTGKKLNVSL